MDLGLIGKVALVAGGSMGLGRAVAEEFAREGARVAICALDDDELARAEQHLKDVAGGEVLAVPADVSVPREAAQFVQTSIARFGTVDILVNNAGGPPSVPFQDVDDDL